MPALMQIRLRVPIQNQGSGGVEPRRTPYQQLADRFGISRERTRQLEHNALRKLRHCAQKQTAAA